MEEKKQGVSEKERIKRLGEKAFSWSLTVMLALIIIFAIAKIVLYNSKINQGQLRPVDVVLNSTAVFEDTSASTGKWSFNVSQKNEIDILIQAPQNAQYSENPTIDDFLKKIKLSASTIVGVDVVNIKVKGMDNNKVYFYQVDNQEAEINLGENNALKLVGQLNGDKQILLKLCVLNKNVLENYVIPDEINEIEYNGKIFELASKTALDLQYNLSFDIEIKEHGGRINLMRVDLTLPSDKLITDGYYVEALDISDFNFVLK